MTENFPPKDVGQETMEWFPKRASELPQLELEAALGLPEGQQALLTPEPPCLWLHFYLCCASERLLFSVWPSVPLTCFLDSHWPFDSMKHFTFPTQLRTHTLLTPSLLTKAC